MSKEKARSQKTAVQNDDCAATACDRPCSSRRASVHRDIKPDNIILRAQDGKPVLIDFGAVKETMNTVIDSHAHSSHSIVVGTPGYMPAEQLSGRPVFASDIYSIGMTAIYALTGKIPTGARY